MGDEEVGVREGDEGDGGPAGVDERSVYEQVRAVRDRAVPVVGAGVAAAAGAASAAALCAALAAELTVLSGEPVDERTSLFDVANRLAVICGSNAVAELVAAQYRGPFITTPALLALVHAPGGRIVTTNYDEAIEQAARQAGLETRSFTPATINEFLQPVPSRAVYVLHLHGSAQEPAGIVLDDASYQRTFDDARVQAGMRALAMSHTLVFFGHSLDPREAHLRRDILWASTSFPHPRQHLLVHRAGELDSDRLASLHRSGITPLAVDDPAGRYWFVGHLAGILGGQSAVTADQEVPVEPDEREQWYEPVRLVGHDQIATAEQRHAFTATDGLFVPVPTDAELQAHGRLLLVGGPGYGKSRLAREFGRQEVTRAVLIRLRNVHPGPRGADPVAVLRTWLDGAVAFGPGVPRPDHEQLAEGVYTLLLDGLDEVPANERHAVLDVIIRAADRLPQHRMVLASRPLELLDTLEAARFVRYDLRPTDRWLRRYLKRRGLDPNELDRLTGGVAAIEELCRIPLFAAAAADRYYQGDPPPTSPLELVLAYANTGLRVEEGKLLAPDPTAVQTWLERLALTMELAGVATIDRADAAGAGLEAGLDLPQMDGLLDHLVERALLSEDGVQVGFHAGVIQETRAAKALLNAPGEAGLDLLARHVLIDIDEVGERGVRPSWSHTIELLAAAAPPLWREHIAGYDRLVVARTTPPGASVDERSNAIAIMWSWYEQHRVWLPRDRPGQLLDDLKVVGLLAADGITDGLHERLRAATSSSDPVARGNAIATLIAANDTDSARAALNALLADPDAMVRRRAAGAAWDLEAAETLPILRERLANEPDGLARRTIAQAVVALTPDDQVIGLLAALPGGLRTHVWWVLDRRWSPAEQLHRLADIPPGDGGSPSHANWIAEWLDQLLRDRSARDWGEAELRLLVRLALTHRRSELIDDPVVGMLGERYPEAVWVEGLKYARDLDGLVDLHALARLDDEAVTRLANAAAAANPAAPAAAAAYLAWRGQLPPAAGSRPHTPPPPKPAKPAKPAKPILADLVDAGDLPTLLGRQPDPAALAQLDPDRRARLDAQLAEALDTWVAAPAPPEETNWQRAPELLVPPRTVWQQLPWWAAVDLPVGAAAWTRLARQPLPDPDVAKWLTTRFDPAFADLLASDLPTWPRAALEHLATLLPDPWPPKLAMVLTEACWTAGVDERTRRRCAMQLARGGQPEGREVLERLHTATGDPLLDEALVQLGDCAAEARLLDRLLATGPAWPITTPSVDLRDHWLASVRCPASAARLQQVLRALLLAGAHSAELTPVFAALLAAAGPDALRLVDQLAADSAVPEGPFLWYRRQELLDALLEQRARTARPDSFHALAALVLDELG